MMQAKVSPERPARCSVTLSTSGADRQRNWSNSLICWSCTILPDAYRKCVDALSLHADVGAICLHSVEALRMDALYLLTARNLLKHSGRVFGTCRPSVACTCLAPRRTVSWTPLLADQFVWSRLLRCRCTCWPLESRKPKALLVMRLYFCRIYRQNCWSAHGCTPGYGLLALLGHHWGALQPVWILPHLLEALMDATVIRVSA